MEQDFDTIPFVEWDIKLDNPELDKLISDDASIHTNSLSEQEKASIDVLVVGREHGERSVGALAKIVEVYRPHVIIHEYTLDSEHQKRYATIGYNGLMFDTRSLVGASSRNIPLGTRALSMQNYLDSIPNRERDDIFPLLRLMRQSNPKHRPIIRLMGEADPDLHTLTGQGLQDALKSTDDEESLIETEAHKIIERELTMLEDISTVIGNVRRKLPINEKPRLNFLIVSGIFHASFLQTELLKLGVSPAGIAGRIALDGNIYNLETSNVSFLAGDELLKKRIEAIRNQS